ELHRPGVTAGRRTPVVIADGAGWIHASCGAWEVPVQAMVLCWYHLRTRDYRKISGSGLPRAAKAPLLRRVLGASGEGRGDASLRESRGAARRPGWIDELIGYLEARRQYL